MSSGPAPRRAKIHHAATVRLMFVGPVPMNRTCDANWRRFTLDRVYLLLSVRYHLVQPFLSFLAPARHADDLADRFHGLGNAGGVRDLGDRVAQAAGLEGFRRLEGWAVAEIPFHIFAGVPALAARHRAVAGP